MTNRISRRALACALLATTALAMPTIAHAASPTFRTLDANGVDLVQGDFITSFVEGSIGRGEAELVLLRTLGNIGQAGKTPWEGALRVPFLRQSQVV